MGGEGGGKPRSGGLRKCSPSQESGESGAPLILELLIFYFNSKQEQLATEGIFRKNASVEDEA